MIAYLIKSAACLLLLLLAYHAFLEREKMHRFNRWFLIGSLILSFTVPLVTINVGASPQLTDQISEINRRLAAQQPAQALPESAPQTTPAQPQSISGNNYRYWLLCLYILVASVLTARLLCNLYELYAKIRNNPHASLQDATLILVDDNSPLHSFLSYIFVDRRLYEAGNIKPAILTHELAHVRQKHSIEILLIELLKIAFWFNPVLYFYKRAIQLNHEFLADEAAIGESKDVHQYQKLLLKLQSENNKDLQLASSIQFSITKKRMIMMTKTTSQLRMICKQLALIPVLAGLIFAFSTRTTSAQNVQQMSLTELMNAVNERIQTSDSLNTDEQEHLRSLIAKMQEKLMAEPPPPPKPKVPEPPQKISERNILSIKVNSKGLIMVENSVTGADELKDEVKEFILNNGSDPNMSESPKQAYLSIETSRELPQKLHREVVEKVEQAYAEIRNEAALSEFGVKFTELKQGSEEYKQIKERYPKNILVQYNPSSPPPPKPPVNSLIDNLPFELKTPSPATEEDSEIIAEISEKFNATMREYLEIPATSENLEQMKLSFERIKSIQKEYWVAFEMIYKKHEDNPPPAPPIPSPPTPESRIEAHSSKSSNQYVSALNFLSEEYTKILNRYLEISPVEENRKDLQIIYTMISSIRGQHSKVLKMYNKDAENTSSFLPLPPVPKTPSDLIKAHSN